MTDQQQRSLSEMHPPNRHKLCYLTTIDGLAAVADLHQLDPSYVPAIAVRHPATFDVALLHKKRQYVRQYDHGWNEQAALLAALIGYGPETFEHVAAVVDAFPAYGKQPDYSTKQAYRDVADHLGRIRDALSGWGYKGAKVGVSFERDGEAKNNPHVGDGVATAALAGVFGDGERADFVVPIWKGNAIRAMEAIAASRPSTILIAPEYYPHRAGRRPAGTIPQHWASPIEPDFYDPAKPWTQFYTCAQVVAFDGDAMVYFRSAQEADGFTKMADIVEAASKPAGPRSEPDPTDPDPVEPPDTDPRTDPDAGDDTGPVGTADVFGHGPARAAIRAAANDPPLDEPSGAEGAEGVDQKATPMPGPLDEERPTGPANVVGDADRPDDIAAANDMRIP